MTEKERLALLRKDKEQEIQAAYEDFKGKASDIIITVRTLLETNISGSKEKLSKLSTSDIQSGSYEDMDFATNENAAHAVGFLLQLGWVADACKYYTDLVNDDDIDEAKSYISSVYDLLPFKNQSAFVSMAKELVELKVLGKEDDAVDKFAIYALCDKEIARSVIELI